MLKKQITLNKFLLITLLFGVLYSNPNENSIGFSITRIHYNGGGDWYSDPSSITNLLNFLSSNTNIAMEMVNLIKTQQAFNGNARILQSNVEVTRRLMG